MSRAKVETLCELLDSCRSTTLEFAGKVPERARLRQIEPGKAHPLWLIGHLAGSANAVGLRWVLGSESILEPEFGVAFAPDFMKGKPITSNAAEYPSWEEVLGIYDRVMKTLIEAVSRLSDEDLPGPPRGKMPERLLPYFSTIGKGVARLSLHDSHHRGQMSLIANLAE